MNISNLPSAIKVVFGLTIPEICSKRKLDWMVYARKVYSVILITEFNLSDEAIAGLTGRDRTTVYGYRKNWKDWDKYDAVFSELLKSVKNQANSLH